MYLHIYDLKMARKHFKLACDMSNNKNGDYLNNLGFVLCQMGCLNDAEIVYSKSIDIDPTNPYYHHNLALFYQHKMKDFDKAKYHLKKACDLDINNERWILDYFSLVLFYYFAYI